MAIPDDGAAWWASWSSGGENSEAFNRLRPDRSLVIVAYSWCYSRIAGSEWSGGMMIYMDSAATSYPKSEGVVDAITDYLRRGASPGRSGHRLAEWSEAQVWTARQRLASLVACSAPERVTFSLNATMSLNAVAHHLGRLGGRVLTSGFEHNSVTRPLHALESEGVVSHEVIPPGAGAPVDLDRLVSELDRGHVGGVLMTWASNVSGEVMPIERISALCRERGVFFAVDAAQSVGYIPVDASLADVVVFAGHKGLGGPQGVGGAVIGEGIMLSPWVLGGSGGRSEGLKQPRWLPWSQEAGTLNGVGIAGLGAALSEVDGAEVARRRDRIGVLRERLAVGLRKCDRVRLTELLGRTGPVGVLSFQIDGMKPGAAADLLEERFDILVRSGLHCAPLAHRTLGTGRDGTVRMSIGPRTTEQEIDMTISAIDDLTSTNRPSTGESQHGQNPA